MLGLVQDGCVVPIGVMTFIPGMFCYPQASLRLSNVCKITCGGWCELYCRYRSMWVGFLCILMTMFPCSVRVRSVSRKGRVPSLSRSMVNCMAGHMLLMSSRNMSTCCLSITQKVSSAYLFQILSACGAILSARSSNISM